MAGENSIHVGVPREAIPFIEEQANQRGMTYHCIIFPRGCTEDLYYELLSTTFDFPTRSTNPQSAMDWLGSLEWFDNTVGHVLVFDGLAELIEADYGIFRELADMLPQSADRQRSGGWSFHAFMIGTDRNIIDKALFDIDDANCYLAKSKATLNPSYPVKVVNHAQ